MRNCSVSEEGDVNVITRGNQPKGISKKPGKEVVLTDEIRVEEQLEDMKDDESGKESIEMNIESESPLDVLLDGGSLPLHPLVCNEPEESSHDDPGEDEVHTNDPQNEEKEGGKGKLQDKRQSCRTDEEPQAEQDKEGRVVPSKLILRFLAVHGLSNYFLR
jgi:hypothetical protein